MILYIVILIIILLILYRKEIYKYFYPDVQQVLSQQVLSHHDRAFNSYNKINDEYNLLSDVIYKSTAHHNENPVTSYYKELENRDYDTKIKYKRECTERNKREYNAGPISDDLIQIIIPYMYLEEIGSFCRCNKYLYNFITKYNDVTKSWVAMLKPCYNHCFRSKYHIKDNDIVSDGLKSIDEAFPQLISPVLNTKHQKTLTDYVATYNDPQYKLILNESKINYSTIVDKRNSAIYKIGDTNNCAAFREKRKLVDYSKKRIDKAHKLVNLMVKRESAVKETNFEIISGGYYVHYLDQTQTPVKNININGKQFAINYKHIDEIKHTDDKEYKNKIKNILCLVSCISKNANLGNWILHKTMKKKTMDKILDRMKVNSNLIQQHNRSCIGLCPIMTCHEPHILFDQDIVIQFGDKYIIYPLMLYHLVHKHNVKLDQDFVDTLTEYYETCIM
jgi:hypothetical protein